MGEDNKESIANLVDNEVNRKLSKKLGWQRIGGIISVVLPLASGVWWAATNLVTKEALAEERKAITADVAQRVLALEQEFVDFKIENVNGYIEYLEDREIRGEATATDQRLLKFNQRRLDRLLRQEQTLNGRD